MEHREGGRRTGLAGGASRSANGDMGDPLRVVIVDNLDELARIQPQWKRLLSTAYRPTEFNTPAAVLTWYRCFNHLTSGMHAVTVWRADELVGLVTLSITRIGPPGTGFRLFNTAGAEHGYHGDPLLGSEPEPVARAIASHLAELVHKGRAVVNIRRMWSDGPIVKALTEEANVELRRTSDRVRSIVRFDQIPDPEAYFERIERKHKISRNLRRLTERFEHVEYVAHDADPDFALDTMCDMLRRRFEPGTGPAPLATAGREAFTRTFTNRMLAAGNARISSLTAGGQRIVVSLDLCVGTRTLGYITAHEPELAKFGLGHLQLYETLRHDQAAGCVEFDLGSAAFAYKQNWSNATGQYCSANITGRNRRKLALPALTRLAATYRIRRLSPDSCKNSQIMEEGPLASC